MARIQHGLKNDRDVITAWVTSPKISPATRDSYLRTVDSFQEFTGRKALTEVTFLETQSWLLSFEQQKPATTRRRLYTIGSLYSFMVKHGYADFNPAAMIETKAPDSSLAARFLEEDEFEKVLVAAEGKLEHYVLMRLLYCTAGRVSEVAGLSWKHIKALPEGAEVTVLGKGSKKRKLVIPECLWVDLQAMRGKARANDPVFTYKGERATRKHLYDMVKDIGRMAGISGLSPHWIRHTAASHALANGMNILAVSRTMGHSSTKVTERYLHDEKERNLSKFLKFS